jgi:hypothetical protein
MAGEAGVCIVCSLRMPWKKNQAIKKATSNEVAF